MCVSISCGLSWFVLKFLQTEGSDKPASELAGLLQNHFERRYECDQCGKYFRWSSGRNEHVRIVHEGRQMYRCMQCPRAFSTSSGLKRHFVGHKNKQPRSSDERQYQCNQCGKCFRRLSGRNEHIQIVHEGRKAYECVQCPRMFSTSNGLKRHLVGHRNKRSRSSNLDLACSNVREMYFKYFSNSATFVFGDTVIIVISLCHYWHLYPVIHSVLMILLLFVFIFIRFIYFCVLPYFKFFIALNHFYTTSLQFIIVSS